MPSPFAAAMRAADSVIDNTFSELVRVEPQVNGEYTSGDDPECDAYQTDMVVGMYPGTVTFKYLGKYDSDKPQLANDEIHVWLHNDRIPSSAQRAPRQGDRLVMLERPDEHPLIIQRSEPDGIGRTMFRCVRAPSP
jgi:hypothetical protein